MPATHLLWFAVAALALSQPALGQSATPEDLVPLQGTWIVSAAEQGGQSVDAMQGAKLTIGDDSFELQVGRREFRGKIKVRLEGSPKRINFLLPRTVWLGIFTVTAKTLRVHYVDVAESAERPQLFATTAGMPGTVLTLQRN